MMPYCLALLHKLARNLRNNLNDIYDSPNQGPESPAAGLGLGYRLYLDRHTIYNNETGLVWRARLGPASTSGPSRFYGWTDRASRWQHGAMRREA